MKQGFLARLENINSHIIYCLTTICDLSRFQYAWIQPYVYLSLQPYLNEVTKYFISIPWNEWCSQYIQHFWEEFSIIPLVDDPCNKYNSCLFLFELLCMLLSLQHNILAVLHYVQVCELANSHIFLEKWNMKNAMGVGIQQVMELKICRILPVLR